MKTIHTVAMVAHLWANRSQPHAQTSNGSFFFSGATLYSYGAHYVVGHWMPDAYARDGLPLVLLNDNSASITTSRHQSEARHALAGVSRLHVPGIEECDVRGVALFGAGRIVETLLGAMRKAADAAALPRIRATTRADRIGDIAQLRADALHLARVDAARRDLSAEHRKRARAHVRALSIEPPRDATREAAEEYARALNRDKWRDDMRQEAESAARIADVIRGYRDAGQAMEAGRALESWDHHAGRVADLCKRGRLRVPSSFVQARRYVESVRDAIEAGVRAAEIAEARARWPSLELKIRDAMAAADVDTLDYMARAHHMTAQTLEALQGEPGDAERRALVEAMRARVEEARAMAAAERGAAQLATARDMYENGRFREAVQMATRAAHNLASDTAAQQDAHALAAAANERLSEQWAKEAEEWRAGERATYPRELSNGNRYVLRVRGDRIETSGGAHIPASAAPAAWRLIRGHVAAGTGETIRPGVRLGHFTLDAIHGNGDIVAGCHVIEFAELQRAAVALGLPA